MENRWKFVENKIYSAKMKLKSNMLVGFLDKDKVVEFNFFKLC